MNGRLENVSVSGDRSHVWGTNSADNIYHRAGLSENWKMAGGTLWKNIALNPLMACDASFTTL